MLDWINSLAPHWFWLILAALLATAEMVVPGVFLIWFAAAAAITGILAFILPIGMAAQALIFAVTAVATVYAGRRWFARNPIISDDPLLNDRGARMIGDIVTVVDAISGGNGRVKVGDSVWSAKGPDTEVGGRVRITGSQGNVLHVEAV
jgi:inner membrane protein